MKLFQPTNKVNYSLVFEISSGSVAGAIVSTTTQAKRPVVVFTQRTFLPLKQTIVQTDINKRLMSSLLALVLDLNVQIQKFITNQNNLKTITVAFTAPFAHTRNNTYFYEAKTPFMVTKQLLQKVKTTASEKTSQEKITAKLLKAKNMSIVDRTTIAYTANNYPVNNPLKKIVTCLSIVESVSVVDTDIFFTTKDILNRVFPKKELVFLTSSLIQQHLLKHQSLVPTVLATIHITYEAMEITIYKDQKIASAFITGIGINTIARNVATFTKLAHEQVYAILIAKDLSLFTPEFQNKVKQALTKFIIPQLQEFFLTTQTANLLPRHFYLLTTLFPSPILIDLLTETLKETNIKSPIFHNLVPTINKLEIINLADNDMGITSLAYFFHTSSKNN